MDIDSDRLDEVLSVVRGRLLSMRAERGNWQGHLSSSALATATAVGALSLTDGDGHAELVEGGLRWLCENVNADGGWGDTPVSESNISTTVLCWAAFGLAGADENNSEVVAGAEAWLSNAAGGLSPGQLTDAIYRRYGDDRTFAVPILTVCALAGRLGDDPWGMIVPLPFELAVFPHRLYKWLNLSVVSYALAALIAIGQVHFHNYKPKNWFKALIRKVARRRTLKKLTEIQPENGGFLEAITLTSFVVISLAAACQKGHIVTTKGIDFVRSTVRPDGSWPIDTDLATWVTTLSVNALSIAPDFGQVLDEEARGGLLRWLTDQQYKELHLYVHADPGGWAWTDKPGGVPDADDTAGAIIALKNLALVDEDVTSAAIKGLEWLMNIQNKDGGIPTFCRGWKDLPFDRSSPDLSAHTLAAMGVWADKVDDPLAEKIRGSAKKAIEFLSRSQHANGSWVPLWFGNEAADYQQNPTYGTARVLSGLAHLEESLLVPYYSMVVDGAKFLVKIQNEDGGWGGAAGIESSIEETALAADALAALLGVKALHGQDGFSVDQVEAAVEGGGQWIIDRFSSSAEIAPSPIGLYFASLWYHEELYPWIFAVSALQRMANLNE
ncbi:MAG: squalene--hopene cyclase [Planctomycetes bacterium]|nr:squalene--hopene cyclase [Planctomycetota bacterium]